MEAESSKHLEQHHCRSESTTMKNSSSKSIVSKLYLSMLEQQFGIVKLRRLQRSSSMKNIAILNTVFQALGT